MKSSGVGYSGKALPSKLGLKPGMRFVALNAPPELDVLLAGAPDLDRLARIASFDCAVAFATTERALVALFAKLAPKVLDTGMIWIAWPKKTSGVATELTEDVVRRVGLAAGLVDIKVCAVDATWSGLKFVRRLRDRRGLRSAAMEDRMTGHSIFATITAALLLAACTSAPVAYPDRTLEGLFDAERAFARASTERGIRASFLEYFAADGVDFRPGPGPMRERTLARPAPADPMTLLLDWSPQAGAIARAGDLGFTTGPYSLRNQRDASAPARYGYFFSVWKRENGVWRVAVDAGVSTPAAPELETPSAAIGVKPAPAWSIPTAMRSDRGKEALLALERSVRSLDPDPADSPSYFELLANSVRVLREDSYALLGADAVRNALAATGRRVFWTPAGAGVSASDDFGYTYGRYARFVGSAEEVTGYYIHVWQRDDAGVWRISAEVLLPPA